MGLRSWIRGLRKGDDERALARAEEMQHETPEEQLLAKGDYEALAAKNRTAAAWGETPHGAQRVTDFDDERSRSS